MKRLIVLFAALAACSPSPTEPIASIAQPLSGPVAAYGFDEGSGSTTADRSGNNLNGTLGHKTGTANPTWTAGKFGNALSFNGTSTWVTVNSAAPLNLTTAMTLEAWVKPTTNAGWRTVISKESPSSFRYALYSSTNGNNSFASVNDSSFVFGTKPANNVWTHLATTFDGTTLRIYVNGALSSSAASGNIPTSSNPLRFGGNQPESEFFNGVIDEIRIYARALSAAEIQSDMVTPISSADAGADAGQDAAADVSQDGASDGAGDVVAEEVGSEASDGDVESGSDSEADSGGSDGGGGNADTGSVADGPGGSGDGGDEDVDVTESGDESVVGSCEGGCDADAGVGGGSGGDSATDAGTVGPYPLRRIPNTRYLVDQAGNPFLIHGDSAWSLIANVTYEDAVLYLDDRKARGFNTIIVNLVEKHFSSNPPRNVYGDAPFLVPGDISTPNEAYFARADAVIRAANDRGIQVLLFPLYLGNNGGNEGFWSELSASGTSKATTYGTFVGNRYASFPGIVYVMGGDYTPPDGASGKGLVNALASAIKSADPNHLMTEHGSRWRVAALADYAGQPWLDFDAVYTAETGGAIGGAVRGEYNRSDWLPVLFLEGQYENEFISTAEVRRQSYEALLSGGMGQIFGWSPGWCFSSVGSCWSGQGPSNWHTSMNSTGAQDQTRVWSLFSVRPWWKLAPQTFLTAGGSGASVELATDHTWGAAYFPTSRSITVNLASFAQTVSGSFYNPTTGAFTPIAGSPFANSGTWTGTTPGGDSVMVFE